MFVLNEGDDTHLCFAFGALQGIDLHVLGFVIVYTGKENEPELEYPMHVEDRDLDEADDLVGADTGNRAKTR